MRRVDALSLEYPFYGRRQMEPHLRRDRRVGRAASGPSADAPDGPGSDLPHAAYERRPAGPSRLSVPAVRADEAVYFHELADGFAAERLGRGLEHVLQPRTSALRAWRTHAGRSLRRRGASRMSIRTPRRSLLREQVVAPPVRRRSGHCMTRAVTASVRHIVELPVLCPAARPRAESDGRRGGHPPQGIWKSRGRSLPTMPAPRAAGFPCAHRERRPDYDSIG